MCVYSGALIGVFAGPFLPRQHLSAESRDAIKISIAMVGTVTALVLGLLIASAKTSFDLKQNELKEAATKIILLDQTLRDYHAPDDELRLFLRRSLLDRFHQLWPDAGMEKLVPSALTEGSSLEELQERLLALSPGNDAQRWLKERALDIASDMQATRWRAVEQSGTEVQWPFLAILLFWLVMIFVSFGIFAPRNASVLAALLVSSLSVAGAVYLFLNLDQPYSGPIRISGAPLMMALEEIQKP
jgi:hypothetical protein